MQPFETKEDGDELLGDIVGGKVGTLGMKGASMTNRQHSKTFSDVVHSEAVQQFEQLEKRVGTVVADIMQELNARRRDGTGLAPVSSAPSLQCGTSDHAKRSDEEMDQSGLTTPVGLPTEILPERRSSKGNPEVEKEMESGTSLEELMMLQLKKHEAATYVVSNEVSDICRLLQGQMAAVMENMAGLTSDISRLAESLERFKANSAEQMVFLQSQSASVSSRETEQGQIAYSDSAKVVKLPAKNVATLSTSPIQSRSSNVASTMPRGTVTPRGLSSVSANKTVMPQTSTGASMDSSPPFAGVSCDGNSLVTRSPSVASVVRVLPSRAASVSTSPTPRQILPMMSLGEGNVGMIDRGVPQFFQAHTPTATLQSGACSVQNFVHAGNPNIHSLPSPDVSNARASSPTPSTANMLLVSPMHNKEPTTTSVKNGLDQRCTEKVPPLGLVDVPPAIFTWHR